MSNDSSGLRDEARAELNPTDTEDTPIEDLDPDWDEDEIARRQTQQPDPIPPRPADGAKAEKWAAYVVALGLHPDEAGKHSRSELIDLADRLGG
jgi:hypothetical protein